MITDGGDVYAATVSEVSQRYKCAIFLGAMQQNKNISENSRWPVTKMYH